MSGSTGDGINVNVTADTSQLDSALQASADKAQAAFKQVGAAAESGGVQVTATLKQLQASLAAAQAQYAEFGGAAKAAVGEYIVSLQQQIAAMSSVATGTRAMGEATAAAASTTTQAAANMVGLNGAFAGLDRTVNSAAESARVFAASLATTTASSAESAGIQAEFVASLTRSQTALQEVGVRLASNAATTGALNTEVGALGTQVSTVATRSFAQFVEGLTGVQGAMLSAEVAAQAFVSGGLTPVERSMNRIATTDMQMLQKSLQDTNVRLLSARAATADTTGSIDQLGTKVRTVATNELQALINNLTGVTSASNTTTSAARTLNTTVTETGTSSRTTAERARDLAEAFGVTATKSHMTSGAMHEVVVEAHELMTGNFSRMPGTTLTLANRMSGLTTNVMLAVAALGALATAAAEAITWLNRLAEAKANATTGGSLYNPQIGEKAINGMVSDAKRITGLAEDEAVKLPAIFARMAGATEPSIRALMGSVRTLSLATGESAEQMAHTMANAYGQGGKQAEDLIAKLQVASQKMGDANSKTFSEAYRDALAANDPLRQRVVLMNALQAATDKAEKDSPRARDRLGTGEKAALAMGSNPEFGGVAPDSGDAWEEARNQKRLEREKAFRDAVASMPATQSDSGNASAYVRANQEALEAQKNQYRSTLDIEHMGADAHQQVRLREAEMDRDFWKQALDKTKDGTNEQIAARAQYMRAQETYQNQEIAAHDRGLREQTAGVRRETAEWIKTTRDTLQAQIVAYHDSLDITKMDAHARETVRIHDAKATRDFWRDAVQTTKAGTEEQRYAREQFMHASEQYDNAMLGQHDRLARAGATAAKKSLEVQLADLAQQQASAKGNYEEIMRLEDQRLALIERSVGKATTLYQNELRRRTQLEQQHDTELREIEQNRINRAEQSFQTELTGAIRTANAQVAVGRQTRDQAVEQLVQMVEQHRTQQMKMLDDYINTLQKGTVAFEKALEQRKTLETKYNTQVKVLQAQAASDSERLQQQATAHMGAMFDNMYRTGASAISGLIMHTETWGGAVKKVMTGMVTDLANSALHMLGTWITNQLAMTATTETQAAIRKAQEAGGTGFFELISAKLAAWFGMESSKTAITAQGTAARTATESSGGFVSLLPSFLARWLGLETAKTATTAAQTAARTATESTAAATQAVQTGAVNTTSALSYAAVGAVAAGASVAAIPLTGWAMAPEVTGATYGYLAGMAGLASLDVGAWNVPQDMVANIHQGEMVVPRDFASGIRGGMTTNSSSRGGDMSYSPTINAGGGVSKGEIAGMIRKTGRDMMDRVRSVNQNGSFVLPGRAGV